MKFFIVNFFLILFLSTSTSVLQAQCNDQLLVQAISTLDKDFNYFKDIKVKLKKSKKNKPPYTIQQSVVLNKGQTYKIYTRNATEYPGQAIFQLHNQAGVLATNYSNGRFFRSVSYTCKKTGLYYVTTFYEEGEEGCSVIVLAVKPTTHEINKYLGN